MKNKFFVLFLFILFAGIIYVSVSYSFDNGLIDFKTLTVAAIYNHIDDSSSDDYSSSSDDLNSSSSKGNVKLDVENVSFSISTSFIIFISIIVALVWFVSKFIKKYFSVSNNNSNFDESNFSKKTIFDYYDIPDSELSKFNIKNKDKLIWEAFNVYSAVQESLMNKDLKFVKSLLSDDLFSIYSNQISTMNVSKIKNIISDIEFVAGRVNDAYQKDDTVIFEIVLEVNCKDYIIDETSRDVIIGSSDIINNYLYELTFVRNLNVNIINCPCCNSELTVTGNNFKCIYCNTVIKRKGNNLVLMSKKLLNQVEKK